MSCENSDLNKMIEKDTAEAIRSHLSFAFLAKESGQDKNLIKKELGKFVQLANAANVRFGHHFTVEVLLDGFLNRQNHSNE